MDSEKFSGNVEVLLVEFEAMRLCGESVPKFMQRDPKNEF